MTQVLNEQSQDFFAGHGVKSDDVTHSGVSGYCEYLFSIFDTISCSFDAPFLAKNDAVAKRIIIDVLTRQDSQLQRHPEDYKLFKLGIMNKVTGDISSAPADSNFVCDLVDLLPHKAASV